jgi:hypothetical protein
MCLGSAKGNVKHMKESLKEWSKVYNGSIVKSHGTNTNLAFRAYKKGLPELQLSDEEYEEYEKYLIKLLKCNEKYISITGSRICFHMFVYLHFCFPAKNIVPNYYNLSCDKKKFVEDRFAIIQQILNEDQ